MTTIVVMATVTAGSNDEQTDAWRLAAAAIAPLAALVLGGIGVLDEQTAVWLALGIGVVTLAVQGRRYAAVEQLDRTGTVTAVALNVLLGLVIVGLKALLAH